MTIGDLIEYKYGIQIPKNDKRKAKEYLKYFITNAEQRIVLVTGQFDPNFYNESLGLKISERLDQGVNTRILIPEKVVGNFEKSLASVVYLNFPFFNSILSAMYNGMNFRQFEKSFNVYFSKENPVNHFSLIDNNLMAETKHKPGAPREVLIKRDNTKYSEMYSVLFEKVISSNKVYPVGFDNLLNQYKNQKQVLRKKYA